MPSLTRMNWRSAAGWHDTGAWSSETVPGLLLLAAQHAPAGNGVADGSGFTTWRELAQWVGDLSHDLRAVGVRHGDIVPVLVADSADFIASVVAVQAVGAVAAPLGYRSGATEVQRIVTTTRARVLIAQSDVDMPTQPGLRRVLPNRRPAQGSLGNSPAYAASELDSDAVGDVMFTSGTTGRPKGVMNSANTKLTGLRGFVSEFDFGPDDVWAQVAPMTHNAGWLYTVLPALLTLGSVQVIPRGDAVTMMETMRASGATVTFLVPTHLEDLHRAWAMDTPVRPLQLRYVITGAAPAGEEVLRAITEDWKTTVVSVYGLTETQAILFTRPDDPLEVIIGTVGRPCPGVEVALRNPADPEAPMPSGQPGELVTRGPNVFLGYLGDEDATSDSFSSDGWFRSGDLAVEHRGSFRIVGRLKDIILRGGATISPRDVEEAICSVLAVERVAVIGLPDARLGERVCACIPAPMAVDLEGLKDLMQSAGLGRALLPDLLVEVTGFPLTDLGKVRSAELRDIVLATMPA